MPKLSDEQEETFGEIHALISNACDLFDDILEASEGRLPSREFSLVYTKLEEAEMWMARAFERLGYEPVEVNPKDDDEDDEEGEPEDESKGSDDDDAESDDDESEDDESEGDGS